MRFVESSPSAVLQQALQQPPGRRLGAAGSLRQLRQGRGGRDRGWGDRRRGSQPGAAALGAFPLPDADHAEGAPSSAPRSEQRVESREINRAHISEQRSREPMRDHAEGLR